MIRKDADSDPVRLLFPDIPEKWSDSCSSCIHTRADHVVDPKAVANLFAVSNCNQDDCKCERWS